jgi:hypothetical protein
MPPFQIESNDVKRHFIDSDGMPRMAISRDGVDVFNGVLNLNVVVEEVKRKRSLGLPGNVDLVMYDAGKAIVIPREMTDPDAIKLEARKQMSYT